ncbi:hypothetical protein KQI63_16470 [bacterium]|nr:hypothetical protein [bacterium]
MTRSLTRLSLLVLLLYVAGTASFAETTRIDFSQLDDLTREQSPEHQIIELDYTRTLSARDRELQWSNPALMLDREDVGTAAELQFSIGKDIELPWVRTQRRAGWNHTVSAADLDRQQRTRDLLAEVKTGYVRLKLNQEYITHLDQLQQTLTQVQSIASEKRAEGHLSAVEERLIQLAVISLNRDRQEVLQKQRRTRADWMTKTGFHESDTLELVTPVSFELIDLNREDYATQTLAKTPAIRAGQEREQALVAQVAMARASLVRSISVYGGLKQIDPDFNGYVAGLSFQLPVLNQNKAAVQGFEAERNRVEIETRRTTRRLSLEAEGLVQSALELRDQLAPIADQFGMGGEHLERLVTSYEEGWMGLTELLNAIQIETTGLSDYHSMLVSYYDTLFRLEALSGKTLVRF